MSLDHLIADAGEREPARPIRSYLTPPSTPAPWYWIWFRALTRPGLEMYKAILEHARPSLKTAFTWLVIAYALGLAFVGLTVLIPVMVRGGTLDSFGPLASRLNLPVTLVGVLMILAMLLIGLVGRLVEFAASAGVTHLIARAFRGTGAFTRLAYLMAAYTAPYTMILSLILFVVRVSAGLLQIDALLPIESLVGAITWLCMLYLLGLTLTGVRAVHGLSAASALAVVLVLAVLFAAGRLLIFFGGMGIMALFL